MLIAPSSREEQMAGRFRSELCRIFRRGWHSKSFGVCNAVSLAWQVPSIISYFRKKCVEGLQPFSVQERLSSKTGKSCASYGKAPLRRAAAPLMMITRGYLRVFEWSNETCKVS
jgi:hypothetical protein